MPQLGTVQTLVVCVPASQGVQGACPAGSVQSVTPAYVITPSEASRFELMSEPFDPAAAWGFFSFAFAVTVAIWWVAHGAGEIINMVRK